MTPGDVGRPMSLPEAFARLGRSAHYHGERLRTGLEAETDLDPGAIERAVEAARASWVAARCALLERIVEVVADETGATIEDVEARLRALLAKEHEA